MRTLLLAMMVLVSGLACSAEQPARAGTVRLKDGRVLTRVFIQEDADGYWIAIRTSRFKVSLGEVQSIEYLAPEANNALKKIQQDDAAEKATANANRATRQPPPLTPAVPVPAGQPDPQTTAEARRQAIADEYAALVKKYGEPDDATFAYMKDLYSRGYKGSMEEAYRLSAAAAANAKFERAKVTTAEASRQQALEANNPPAPPVQPPVARPGPVISSVCVIAPSLSTTQAAREILRAKRWQEVQPKDAGFVLVVCRSSLFDPLKWDYKSFAELKQDAEYQLNISGPKYHAHVFQVRDDLSLSRIEHSSTEAKE